MAPVGVTGQVCSFVSVPKGVAVDFRLSAGRWNCAQLLLHFQMCLSNPSVWQSNSGSFHLNVDTPSALKGKPFHLLAGKAFKKHSSTRKSQTHEAQTTAKTLLRRLQVHSSFVEVQIFEQQVPKVFCEKDNNRERRAQKNTH